MPSTTVLQPWVEKIGWKMQSILFSGLRGPDNQQCANVKKVGRWLRSISQNNADPSKDYMKASEISAPPEAKLLDKELENLPVHFVHHFADALRIVAIFHPEESTRKYAWDVHYFIAEELFHFVPESDYRFLARHEDKV